jgi:large subunit ribosomal protein L3
MRTGLIAEKLGMTCIFTDSGIRQVVTFLKIDNCQVVGKKNVERDGYSAVVLGVKGINPKKLSKSVVGMFSKVKIEPKAKIKEFRVSENNLLEIGSNVNVDHFSVGQFVDVTGVTIGKGFAGSMKRHNFRGLEASHGVSISHRSHGSTGGRQDPGKVFKNKKMAGHMGDTFVTIQNLKIIEVDIESGILMVSGSVPGSKGSYVYLKDAVKKQSVMIGG